MKHKLFKMSLSVAISALVLIQTTAFADVLGTHISTTRTQIAPGTTYVRNVFNSTSVGKQTENYIEYIPNEDAAPILTNGYTAYGKRTLTQANNILIEQGLNTAAGMNADFFSFQTGVPMSNTVIDGKIFTADSSALPGIGFRDDGTAFTGTFSIVTTVTADNGSSFTVECINKYRQPYALYLFNRDFADNTHSPDAGRDIVLGSVSGDFKLGGEITAVVESISDNDGSVPIPEGKLVLGVSESAAQEIKDRLNCLSEGTKVTISTYAAFDAESWNNAAYALSCTGGKLLTNGALDLEDESAAPRSAIGIRPDGSIIFYTVDGRQSGYSYGARKETVARRLLELGCTEAVNLDGGGSTTMGVNFPGTDNFSIVNSPSDGRERSCANFLFVLRLAQPDGIPYSFVMDNDGTAMLSGASASVAVTSAYDKSFGYAEIPSDIEYKIIDDADTPDGSGRGSYVNNEGWLSVHGNGDIYVRAKSGDISGSAHIVSVTTPDTITLYNSEAGYQLNEMVLEPNSTVKVDAVSSWYGTTLLSDSTCYSWTIASDNESVGEIDESGFFRASDASGATGRLCVNAGLCTVEIPILILGEQSGSDTTYPEIKGSVINGKLTAIISYNNIRKENITLTIDGRETDFDFNEDTDTLSYYISDNLFHRIGVFVKADDGKSAISFYDTSDISGLENSFPDTAGHWASGYISYLADQKVLNGSLDGDKIQFRPDDNMTRCEFAIMLCNYLGIDPSEYADVDLPFIDVGEIPFWAANQVKAVYSRGVMQGQLGQYGVSFNPNANINRMEFAISLNRLLPDGLEAVPVTAADKDDIPFWAEDAMRTICTQKIMTGYPDGTLKPLNNVTRAEAAKMMYNIFGI